MGNILSFAAAVLLVAMGLAKTRKKMLTLQLGQLTFLGLSNVVLGAYTGAVLNAVSILRNVLSLKVKYTWTLKLILTAILIGPGLLANRHGFLGVLPIIGTTLITCFLDVENVVKLKTVYIISQSAWIFYDFAVQNYVSAATDAFGIVSNIIGIVTVKRTVKE